MKKLLLAMGLVTVVFILPQSEEPNLKNSARKLLERSLKPGTGSVPLCKEDKGRKINASEMSDEYWMRLLEEVINETGV